MNDLGRILEKQTSKVKQERGKGNEFEEGDKCFPTRKSAEDGTIEDCFSNGNSIEYFMKIFPNTFANNRRIEEMGVIERGVERVDVAKAKDNLIRKILHDWSQCCGHLSGIGSRGESFAPGIVYIK